MAVAKKHPSIRKISVHNKKIVMCLVADSGWGKTVFAGTAGARALILSVDPEGTDSAAFQGSEADEWVARTYEEIDECFRWYRDEGHKLYDWLFVDGITEVQRIFMRKALQIAHANNPKRDPDVPGLDQHQKVQIQILNFTKQVIDLPGNVCFMAYPYRFDDDEGEPYYLPMVHGGQGDLAQQFMGYMKVVGHGVLKEVEVNGKKKEVRRIYFQPVGPYRAKDRFDALGKYKDDLTIPKMEKLIADRAAAVGTTTPARTTRRASRTA